MQLARLVHVTEMALAEKENRYMSNSNPGNKMQYNTIQYNAKDEKKAFRSPRGYYRGKNAM